jgi:hypothetical protein
VSLIGAISFGRNGIVFKAGKVDYLLDIPQKDIESIGLKDGLLVTIDGLTFKVPKGGPQAGALVLVANEVSINTTKFTIKR